MALERQNMHIMIVTIENIVGDNFEKPSVVFKKLFEAIPNIIAMIKKKVSR